MKQASVLRDYVEEHGWKLVEREEFVCKHEWDQLCADSPSLNWNRNFISGNWRGTEFLLFGIGDSTARLNEQKTQAIIGFRKTRSATRISFASAIFDTESSGWQRFESENWLFLVRRAPRHLFRVPVGDLAGFAEEATTLFHQVYE